MIDRVVVVLLFVLLSATAVADDEIVESLATLMAGVYAIDTAETRMTDRRTRIVAPDIGDVVFYLQVNQGPELAVYRQRILVLEADGDRVIQHAYSFHEPGSWVDASAQDLAGLMQDAVKRVLPRGCETVWTAIDDGFRGYTDPNRCTIISSRTGKPRRIESETLLSHSTLSLVERGFDEQGAQLFGTMPGESLVLLRKHSVPGTSSKHSQR